MKSNVRYLKKIINICLVMSAIITFVTLAICWRAGEISSGIVTALCAIWSIELALSALIKITEGKTVEKKHTAADALQEEANRIGGSV